MKGNWGKSELQSVCPIFRVFIFHGTLAIVREVAGGFSRKCRIFMELFSLSSFFFFLLMKFYFSLEREREREREREKRTRL